MTNIKQDEFITAGSILNPIKSVIENINVINDRIDEINSPISTGSITSRTLKDRFADIVNVKDFGAKGNGITDDTAAFEAAAEAGKTPSTAKSELAVDP